MSKNKVGWPLLRTGVVLANCHSEFLLIQDAKEKRIADGKVELVPTDKGKWGLPGGCVESGSDFGCAASCKGTRSSGYDFDTQYVCHIGFQMDADDPHVIVVYYATHPYDVSVTDPLNPEEVANRGWFTYDSIVDMVKLGQVRDPEVVINAIDSARAGVEIPRAAITIYFPNDSEESPTQVG